VLEIAKPAMDQLAGGRGRGATEVAALSQEDAQSTPRGVARDARAIHAAADDHDVLGR
jgi:hypothetical protein